jgi:hypothetical protein
VTDNARTNGFRIRTLNADCDRLAVQSSVQGTWFCSFRGKLFGKLVGRHHDVGITQAELIVLRPYQGKPVIELEGLGGPHGVLIVDRANGGSTVLRNGQRRRFELDCALVIKTEHFKPPGRDGASLGAV